MSKCKQFPLLSALILFLGIFLLIPSLRIQAASGDNWKMSNGTLTITGNDFDISTTTLSDFKEDIQKVVIQDGVTSLQSGAFEGCTNLTSVTIPSSLTKIPSSCFQECSSLVSVKLPETITELGLQAFYECSSLKTINLPGALTSLPTGVFHGCSSLSGSLIIPEGITEIDSFAFSKCSGLTSVQFSHDPDPDRQLCL